MKLIIENNTTVCLVGGTEEAHAMLSGYLTIEDPQAHYKGMTPDQAAVKLWNPMFKSFPTGNLWGVAKELRLLGTEVEIEDLRVRPCEPDLELLDTFAHTPHDYQRAALERFAKRTRGVLEMGTGAGKGDLACMLGMAWPCRWLFVVHRGQIALETAERFQRLTGEAAGVVMKGRQDIQRFTVATFQTLWAARHKRAFEKFIPSIDGLIVDEVHTAPSETYRFVCLSAKNAYWRCGLSATPNSRSDNKGPLGTSVIGPVIYSVPVSLLVERGQVAQPVAVLASCVQDTDLKALSPDLLAACDSPEDARDLVHEDSGAVYDQLVVRSAKRNALVLEMVRDAKARDRTPALLFVKALPHGRILKKLLERDGLRVAWVSGEMADVGKRKDTVRALGAGELDVVVGSKVLTEGIDEVGIRSVINAAGRKSVIEALQQGGRAMRTEVGRADGDRKMNAYIYDIDDSGGHRWLERWSKSRINAYIRAGYLIEQFDGVMHQDAGKRKRRSKNK